MIKLRATTALPLLLLSLPAVAQTGQPVIVTPPIGNFSLPPSQTPTPRPTPSPAVTPSAPTPSPTATATPAPRPTTRAAPRPTPTPAPTRAPAPAASPTPTPTSDSPTSASPTPAATSTATPLPAADATGASDPAGNIAVVPSAPADTGSDWLWALLGGGLLLAGGLIAGWLLGRRRGERHDLDRSEVYTPPAAPAPPPAPPVPTPGPPARVSPPPAALTPPPDSALVAELRPLRVAMRDGLITLDFELFVQNRGSESADNIRAVLALMGANAQQDEQLAGFFGSARMATGSEPFSIAPGGVFMLNGQVSLPDDAMPAVKVQDRPMFVPIVPIALRWYAGLSIRTLRDAFMVGTVPTPGNDKLGPLWVERAASGFGPLAAKRYAPRSGS